MFDGMCTACDAIRKERLCKLISVGPSEALASTSRPHRQTICRLHSWFAAGAGRPKKHPVLLTNALTWGPWTCRATRWGCHASGTTLKHRTLRFLNNQPLPNGSWCHKRSKNYHKRQARTATSNTIGAKTTHKMSVCPLVGMTQLADFGSPQLQASVSPIGQSCEWSSLPEQSPHRRRPLLPLAAA